MEIELSNGQLRFWQWDTGQKARVPENVPTVHFKFGAGAVELPVENRWVDVPDELLQTGKDILLWTYREDHTLDAARIPVERRPKPADYIYTPTEVKTWKSLDARITALEKGGGVDAVTSVNGKTGAVELTAEDVGAATEEYVDNNSKLFVINITDSLNSSNDKVYSADKTYSEILGALNNGLLPVCKMPKHTTGSYVYGLCYFSGRLTPPIGSDRFFFRSLDIDTHSSTRTTVSINPSNYVEVTSEPVVMTGATDSRSGIPGYVPVPQSSERNYFLRGDAKWKPALQPPVIASVGQYLSVKTVDNNGIVTETEAVDAPSAGDLSLGLTGATVGQTVKISAVDENGVPTAWVPVDMASGGSEKTLALIADITLSDGDAVSYKYTGLGGLTELYFVGRLTNGTIDTYLTATINETKVTNRVIPVKKTAVNATWNYWCVARFNGAFWTVIVSPEHAGADAQGAVTGMFTTNSVVLGIGEAESVELYTANPAFKPTSGWLKIWGR